MQTSVSSNLLYIMVRFYNPAKKHFEAAFGCTLTSNASEVFMLSITPMESKDSCLMSIAPVSFSRSPSDFWDVGYTCYSISP